MLSACHAAFALTRSSATRALAADNQLWSPLKINKGINASKIPFIYRQLVDWQGYSRAILSPVIPEIGVHCEFASIWPSEEETLRAYLDDKLRSHISKKFQIAETVTENAIRIKYSLTGSKPNIPILSTIARLDPLTSLFNIYQACRGAEGTLLGSITYWIEVQDASTGKLLLAFVGRGYPNPLNLSASFGRLTAAKYGIESASRNLMRFFEEDIEFYFI